MTPSKRSGSLPCPDFGLSFSEGLSIGLGCLLGFYLILLHHQHWHVFSTVHTESHAKLHERLHRELFSGKDTAKAAAAAAAGVPESSPSVGSGVSSSVSVSDSDAIPVPVPSTGTSVQLDGESYRPKIIFAVPMPWPLKDDLAKDNLIATITTWGSHATRLVLVVSQQQIDKYPPDTSLGEEHSQIKDYLYPVQMERPDGISNGRHIWEKMWRGWKLVGDRFRFEADWFVKADLDTFVAVENMRAFLSHLNPDDPYYFGHSLFHDWQRHNLVFNSGTCYILSRESLRRLSIRLNRIEPSRDFTYQCGDGPGAREDPHTAGCLRDVGVLASDSLDHEGKQRFQTFRPKDHMFAMKSEKSWFWKFKDKSKDLLECCSDYPISYHNFKSHPRIVYNPEAYYTLEYYLSGHPYEAVRKAMSPPRGGGRIYEMPEGVDFELDEDRNVVLATKKEPRRKLANWLRTNPDARDCVNRTKSCRCRIPNIIPHLGAGVMLDDSQQAACRPGGTVNIFEACSLRCKEGFLDPPQGLLGDLAKLACPDGSLLYPKPIDCKAKCTHGMISALLAKDGQQGDKYVEGGTGVVVTCGQGRALSNGKKTDTVSCSDGALEEKTTCAACTTWTLDLEGSSYTHKSWKQVTFQGNENSKFEVAAVATGSEEDPNKNCAKFHQEHQLLLRLKNGPVIKALSCGNQVIKIIAAKKQSRTCP